MDDEKQWIWKKKIKKTPKCLNYDVQASDESNSLNFVTHTRIMMGQREEA